MPIPSLAGIIPGLPRPRQARRLAGLVVALGLAVPLSSCAEAPTAPPRPPTAAVLSPVPASPAATETMPATDRPEAPTASPEPGATETATPEPSPTATASPSATPATPTPVPALAQVALPPPAADDAPSHQIPGARHVYQKWNNCAPSSAVMLLSVFGQAQDQLAAAAWLKPDTQDTNVSPEELAAYLRGQGLEARAMVGLDLGTVKRLVRAGVPVIAEQWIDVAGRGQMGHYRVITGYDDGAQSLTMQDSYYGGNRPLAYATFESEWRPFNGAAVLGYRPEQASAVSEALGPLADDGQRLQAALQLQTAQAQAGGDALAWFALAELRSRVGDHGGAVEAAERALSMGLPPRAMWYQFGPYRSYLETGQLERLLALTDQTLAFMGGKNLEESHYWRGMALRGLGREEEARASFAAALQFHPGYAPAEQALGGP